MQEFWSKVTKGDGCWIFGAHLASQGYRVFQGTSAHRFSWALANGPIPVGMSVLHRCDNPPCVRPEHLFIGTQKDNMADASAKGRLKAQKIYTVKEAAAVLGLAPSTLRHQIRLGKLTAVKWGRDHIIAAEEVERYRQQHRRNDR